MPLYGTAFYEQAKAGGYIRDGFCDYALAATEPWWRHRVPAEEISMLCMKANAINRTLTRKKVLKAMRHPVRRLR
jgi:hypothetical protein